MFKSVSNYYLTIYIHFPLMGALLEHYKKFCCGHIHLQDLTGHPATETL